PPVSSCSSTTWPPRPSLVYALTPNAWIPSRRRTGCQTSPSPTGIESSSSKLTDSQPATSDLHRVAGIDPLDCRAGCRAGELVRRSGEQREGAPVAGHAARVAEQLERERGLLRPHREEVADRQHGHVRLVDPGDQRHVAEHAR